MLCAFLGWGLGKLSVPVRQNPSRTYLGSVRKGKERTYSREAMSSVYKIFFLSTFFSISSILKLFHNLLIDSETQMAISLNALTYLGHRRYLSL